MSSGTITPQPQPPRAVAKVNALLTGGAPATRVLVAGALLVVGLPVLTILVYVWGYPSTPVPPALVVSIDGLQILIILNAIMVAFQLAATQIRVPKVFRKHRQMAEAREIGPAGLRELSFDLAEMIWEHERGGRSTLGPAILDYVHDAVTAELGHRRRRQILERRLVELEVLMRGRPADLR